MDKVASEKRRTRKSKGKRRFMRKVKQPALRLSSKRSKPFAPKFRNKNIILYDVYLDTYIKITLSRFTNRLKWLCGKEKRRNTQQ